jgi:hypothetical protein
MIGNKTEDYAGARLHNKDPLHYYCSSMRCRQSLSYDRYSRQWNHIPDKVTFQITNCIAESWN